MNKIIKYMIALITLGVAAYLNKIYNTNDDIKTKILYWVCVSFTILIPQLISFYTEKEKEQKDNFNKIEKSYKNEMDEKEKVIENYKIECQNLLNNITKVTFNKNDNSHYIFLIFIENFNGKIKKNLNYNLEIIINCLTDENLLNDFKLVFPDNFVEINQNEAQKNNSSHILKSKIPTITASKAEYNFQIKDKYNVYKYQKCCCMLKIKNQYKKENFEFGLSVQDYDDYSISNKIYNFDII